MEEATDHAQIPLAPPLIFLGYLVSALVLQWLAPLLASLPAFLRILGGLLLLAGFLLAGWAVMEMRRAHTSPDPHRPTTAIVTTGPYRYTRNPIYLGFLLIYLGFTLMAGTVWGVVLSPFLIGTVTKWIIRAEETYLGNKFKEEYGNYLSRVHRWV